MGVGVEIVVQGVLSLPEELEVYKSSQASLVALSSGFGNATMVNTRFWGCDDAQGHVRTENNEVWKSYSREAGDTRFPMFEQFASFPWCDKLIFN